MAAGHAVEVKLRSSKRQSTKPSVQPLYSHSTHQFYWAPPGGAPVHDLAVVDEVGHGADDLLQGAVRVVLVDQHLQQPGRGAIQQTF